VKIRKKTAMALSFALGSIMFATTAMAEVASKSGYEQLKDAFKFSSESCSEKLSSYTMDMSFVVKDNNKIVASYDSVNKYDRLNDASETTATDMAPGTKEKRKSYSYTDKNGYINYVSEQDTYYVTESKDETRTQFSKDPFKEKAAGDMEKIVDALIGNLKDSVVVSEKADGSKELSGSVSEAQIPAIANALVSFGLKNQFLNSYNAQRIGLDKVSSDIIYSNITKDIYVKEVKGNMVLTKDGLIQSVLGTAILSGKDEEGKEHILTFELLGKLVDVNLTKVTKPDLSGKKVQKSANSDYNKLNNPEKYVGTYKNDMIIEKDGKFQKIGEAIVDIASFDSKNIAGRYHEEYNKGFEAYATNKKDFKFNGKFSDSFNGEFERDSISGKAIKGYINIRPNSSNIYFNINENSNGNVLIEGQFSRVFN
jgi:hypothetical protein